MQLPSKKLVMLGLGIKNDTPPNTLQLPLKDGIHLRWSFLRNRGFPWYGYYLFRREYRKGKVLCFQGDTKEISEGTLANKYLLLSFGRFESDNKIILTNHFQPFDKQELDLANRSYLRFKANREMVFRQVEAEIGFLPYIEGKDINEKCFDFFNEIAGKKENPIKKNSVLLEVQDRKGIPLPNVIFEKENKEVGLKCSEKLEITLPCEASSVKIYISRKNRGKYSKELGVNKLKELRVLKLGNLDYIRGFNDYGKLIKEHVVKTPVGEIDEYILKGGISRIIIESFYSDIFLHKICYLCYIEREIEIDITAFLWNYPVAKTTISGFPGEIKSVSLHFDMITFIEISAGPAVLIDLCIEPLFQKLFQKGAEWNYIPNFPYPLCLPVAHRDYRCANKPSNQAEAENMAINRIVYGSPDDWRGVPFNGEDDDPGLHGVLQSLVVDGPPPSGKTMLSRVARFDEDETKGTPGTETQHPLELVILGSLNPPIAQMVGLYWLDDEVSPDKAYDYLIIADHNNKFGGSPKKAITWADKGFDTRWSNVLDYYIVSNKKMQIVPVLPSTENLRVYALPGSFVQTKEGDMVDAINNAGLLWDLEITDGHLTPDGFIMHHIWRADLGDAEPSTEPLDEEYSLLTKESPVFLGKPSQSFEEDTQYPSDWPPFHLFAIDRGLKEGWYSYKINGVDIFGRHSLSSSRSKWHQWAPEPNPKPWYYQSPADNRMIHQFSVSLLDKSPPPPPIGVEAFALDPEDTYILKDETYNNWLETLSDSEKTNIVGLRVKWIWTLQQNTQAPDIREFRIYFNHSPVLPNPDHSIPLNWEERYRVVNKDDDVKTEIVDDDGNLLGWQYEIILPASGDGYREGLPLTVSLENPIDSAYIGVSAVDDKEHTLDDPKWYTGRWGGDQRYGNESIIVAPCKIYRVRRIIPPKPEPIEFPPDSPKIFATPANYHGHSYYTYRWKPLLYLKVHVFRAIDSALFNTDWNERLIKGPQEINEDQVELFPPDWDELRCQGISIAINELASIDHEDKNAAMIYYRELSNDALQVLAGLPGNEKAFNQITILPLDPDNSEFANRLCPDDVENQKLIGDSYTQIITNSDLRIYIDELDGRSTNRYYYRSVYVDGAENRSEFSLSSPPIWLPNVMPPRTPVITEILAGDCEITIKWASNRETDLEKYQIYRTDVKENARDIKLMDHIHTINGLESDPISRPKEVSWTDTPLPGLKPFYYRITAVDDAENVSKPTKILTGKAYDESPPIPPIPEVSWELINGENRAKIIWSSLHDTLLQRCQKVNPNTYNRWKSITGWMTPNDYEHEDKNANSEVDYKYRLWARKLTGVIGIGNEVELAKL